MNGELILEKIVKRNGVVAEFQIEKIEHAIFKAMRAIGKPNRARAKELSIEVLERLIKEQHTELPAVEQVQDIVEKVLFEQESFELVKAYLLYRKQREQSRNAKELFGNIDAMDDYLGMHDWRIKESANSAYWVVRR